MLIYHMDIQDLIFPPCFTFSVVWYFFLVRKHILALLIFVLGWFLEVKSSFFGLCLLFVMWFPESMLQFTLPLVICESAYLEVLWSAWFEKKLTKQILPSFFFVSSSLLNGKKITCKYKVLTKALFQMIDIIL